jgi:hypothetical protein
MTDQPHRPHGYWIILAGNTPTSFRSRTRDVLVPTFVQLQRTQPSVSLKWFERSRVWTSPGEAREALLAQRQKPRRREHPPDWRPGGDHQDPRKRFELTRDQKRAKFKARQRYGPPDPNAPRAPERTGPPKPSDRPKPWQSRPSSGGAPSRPRGGGKASSRGPWRPGPRKPGGGGSRGPR